MPRLGWRKRSRIVWRTTTRFDAKSDNPGNLARIGTVDSDLFVGPFARSGLICFLPSFHSNPTGTIVCCPVGRCRNRGDRV